MATWVVGDVHGCAAELGRLLEALALGPEDELVLLGDLFHRGPDPLGVLALLRPLRARFLLGNHEHVLLQRLSGRDPALPLTPDDLRGDSARELHLEPARAPELLDFLSGHSGYYLESHALPNAGPTPD